MAIWRFTEEAMERAFEAREPTMTPEGEWIEFASDPSAGYRLRRRQLNGPFEVPIGPGGTEERTLPMYLCGETVVFVRLTNDGRTLASDGWFDTPSGRPNEIFILWCWLISERPSLPDDREDP